MPYKTTSVVVKPHQASSSLLILHHVYDSLGTLELWNQTLLTPLADSMETCFALGHDQISSRLLSESEGAILSDELGELLQHGKLALSSEQETATRTVSYRLTSKVRPDHRNYAS